MAIRKNLRRRVIERDRGICQLCHHLVSQPDEQSLDHIIPVSKGGLSTYENLRLAHKRCNSQRGNGEPQVSQPSQPKRRLCKLCNNRPCFGGCRPRVPLVYITNENAHTFLDKLAAQKQDEEALAAWRLTSTQAA